MSLLLRRLAGGGLTTLTATRIPSAESIPQARVERVTAATRIPSAEQVYAARLERVAAATLIASAMQVNQSRVERVARATQIVSAALVYQAAVERVVSAQRIASGETIYQASVQQLGTRTLTATRIGSAEVVFQAAVTVTQPPQNLGGGPRWSPPKPAPKAQHFEVPDEEDLDVVLLKALPIPTVPTLLGGTLVVGRNPRLAREDELLLLDVF